MDKIERLLVVFEAVKPPLVAKMFTVETPSPTDWQTDRLNKYIKLSNQAAIIFVLKWLTEPDRFYHITNQ